MNFGVQNAATLPLEKNMENWSKTSRIAIEVPNFETQNDSLGSVQWLIMIFKALSSTIPYFNYITKLVFHCSIVVPKLSKLSGNVATHLKKYAILQH